MQNHKTYRLQSLKNQIWQLSNACLYHQIYKKLQMVECLDVNLVQPALKFTIKSLNNSKVYSSKADNRSNGAVYQKDNTYFPVENRRENL